jgi:hypothetical protein
VRTRKRIVVIQAQFAFTDFLAAPSPPSRACCGGHRGSTSAQVVTKVIAVSHRDGDGNFKPVDTETSVFVRHGQAQGAVCGTCVCVIITAVPITKLFAWGGGDSGGHVLRETTSRGLCGLVCPSRTSERGGEGYCVKEGGGEEGEREREHAREVRLHYSLGC